MVHANSIDSWHSALDAHPDIIAHGIWIWPGEAADSIPTPEVRSLIAAAARSGTYVQPTLQTVAGERAMVDAKLLDDPRLAMALPRAVISYLRSSQGEKVRKALLEEYLNASPPPGFERLLSAAIERTRASFKLMFAGPGASPLWERHTGS